MMMATKRKKTKIVAEILIGFGVLFQGMFIMTDAVKPLSDSPMFHDMFQTLGNNPLLGVLVGALVLRLSKALQLLSVFFRRLPLNRSGHLFGCVSDYYGTEYWYLCYLAAFQHRDVKECKACGNGTSVF